DVAAKRYAKIVTRFPPEPNGYLHIGHAKSICLNFGIAREHDGQCNLRFDDTNPAKEETEYVDSITADVQWLIAGWAGHCLGFKPKGATAARVTSNGRPDYYLAPVAPGANSEPFSASSYFDQLYDYAVTLIQGGAAYVCDLSPEDTDKYRGAPDRPGKDSPWRNRTVAENLDLFARMKSLGAGAGGLGSTGIPPKKGNPPPQGNGAIRLLTTGGKARRSGPWWRRA
ncbi:MAG TPA: glutamate--tRNA ligase family protein, partial [Lacunisphaera sp.]|nr:glutamate--tRNA ligase family protein [Lacunisphaera sp.]